MLQRKGFYVLVRMFWPEIVRNSLSILIGGLVMNKAGYAYILE